MSEGSQIVIRFGGLAPRFVKGRQCWINMLAAYNPQSFVSVSLWFAVPSTPMKCLIHILISVLNMIFVFIYVCILSLNISASIKIEICIFWVGLTNCAYGWHLFMLFGSMLLWCFSVFLWCFHRCFDVKVQTAAAFVALMRALGEDISRSLNLAWNRHQRTLLHVASLFSASKIGSQRGGLSLATCLKYASTFSHLQRLVRSRMFKTILCTYTYIKSIKSQTWKVLVLSDFLWLLRQSLVTFMDSFEAQMAPSGRLKVLWSKKLRRARFNLFFASCQNASRMYRCHVNLKIVDVSFKILSKASNQTETVLRRLASLLCPTKKRTDVIKVEDETWWDMMRRIESPKDGFVFSSFPASKII